MMASITVLLGHLLGAQDTYVVHTSWLYVYTSGFFVSVVLIVRSLFTAVLDSAYTEEERVYSANSAKPRGYCAECTGRVRRSEFGSSAPTATVRV